MRTEVISLIIYVFLAMRTYFHRFSSSFGNAASSSPSDSRNVTLAASMLAYTTGRMASLWCAAKLSAYCVTSGSLTGSGTSSKWSGICASTSGCCMNSAVSWLWYCPRASRSFGLLCSAIIASSRASPLEILGFNVSVSIRAYTHLILTYSVWQSCNIPA